MLARDPPCKGTPGPGGRIRISDPKGLLIATTEPVPDPVLNSEVTVLASLMADSPVMLDLIQTLYDLHRAGKAPRRQEWRRALHILAKHGGDF